MESFGAKRLTIHIGLFLLTLFTTTVAGVQWIGYANPFELGNLALGLPYSIAVLFVLGSHEFGHYFAARHHKVDVTLPFFIPFPAFSELMGTFLNFGTFGAVIRTRSVVPSRRAMFDIGVTGPIAGFIASLLVLAYGFTHLPGREFMLAVHPDFDFALGASKGAEGMSLEFGQPLAFRALKVLLTDPGRQFVPPMTEIYHFPFLCVGWFGLFVTALNLIPLGQFDGGHLSYALFGERHRTVARWTFIALLLMSAPALLDIIYRSIFGWLRHTDPGTIVPFASLSWWMWFLWALVAYFFVKLYHPPSPDETPLDEKRVVVGWLTILIFILSFSPVPIIVTP